MYKEDRQRVRWWLWLKGDEDVLCNLEVTLDEHWKVQKHLPIIGFPTIRVLTR